MATQPQPTAAALQPNEAEQRVIAAAAAGAVCDFRVNNPAADDPARAKTWGAERALRADVLRALCLGLRPDWPLDPRGVQVQGARIDGALDLEAATVAVRLAFWGCAFTAAPIVRDATLKVLSLDGSRLPGLEGDRLTVEGALLLRGTRASGEVRLLGAKIGGNLDCSGGSFENPEGVALNADRADVQGVLFWRQLQAPPAGRVSLAHATVGVLADDLESWPGPGALDLSGFVYGTIAASSMADAEKRLDWLRRQNPRYFSPQPYEQLAKVLRQMGHDDDARKIAIARKQALIARSGNRASRLARHLVLWPVGYGYRPGRALGCLLALIAFGTLIFSGPVGGGTMLPVKLGEAQVTAYRTCAALPSGYPRFQPLVYAIDTALPIIDFHQEAWWMPDEADVRGFWTQVYLWLHIALGWLLTTLGIAAVTGIIKRD
ncbi:MAG: hypothetical protein P9C36_07200 [Defluviicoccus sp.]|nr:hypothetical protein [Defluviicoccus sp.]MDG4592394.1 hypothetical protein [Defluviicoccus sp.]